MPDGDVVNDGETTVAKPKRVRTGCLTCRERHLKCDEALPNCNNCRKSNRECKRGLRLNFIDTWVERPPTILSVWGTTDWRVDFTDESREIASEYKGGRERYKRLSTSRGAATLDPSLTYGPMPTIPQLPHRSPILPILPIHPTMSTHSLPSMQSLTPVPYPDPQPLQHLDNMVGLFDGFRRDSTAAMLHHSNPSSVNGSQTAGSASVNSTLPRNGSVANWTNGHQQENSEVEDDRQGYLDTPEKTLFMQVFVEEVGVWMDSMDSMKHFSRLIPFHSLAEPMLLNAFLACGARHLALVNPAYKEEQALNYYDTATHHLLLNLQNPNRDTVICATTAVILNVYEIMSERALQRMNHIAGARALIKECGWTARSQGIGGACFWLNVGLEVLSCLHFNWQIAWDPDEWGIDMDMTREVQNCREELWTHRMLYLVAKVSNLRASISRQNEADPQGHHIRAQQQYQDWYQLKTLIDTWNDSIPRTMHPLAYVNAFQTASKSCFPEVWLVKRSTIVARLFYHTALLLLAQIHPYHGQENPEIANMLRQHSQMICGIVAHVKDRGVASVALRSLPHAAEVLTDRREQQEVLEIFGRINRETGWRIGFVYAELMAHWGWSEEPSPRQLAQTHTVAKQQQEANKIKSFSPYSYRSSQHPDSPNGRTLAPPPTLPLTNGHDKNTGSTSPAARRPPAGISNPMYAKADFNLPQHPYQAYYVAPNHQHTQSHSLSSYSLGTSYSNGHANANTDVNLNGHVNGHMNDHLHDPYHSLNHNMTV